MQPKEFSIGRADTNTIVINDPQISKYHARLIITSDNIAIIIDLESTNGTFVNGIQIQEKQLGSGDQVTLGNHIFTWESILCETTSIDLNSNTKNKKVNKNILTILFFVILFPILFFVIINTDWSTPKSSNIDSVEPMPWDLRNDSISYQFGCLKENSKGGELIELANKIKIKVMNLESIEVSTLEEEEVGREIKKQMDDNAVYNNSMQYKGRIDLIMSNLLDQMPLKKFNYQCFVIESEDVNAFTAGGYIFIMTGIIDFAESDDELACVIGHEIFHNELGHIQDKLREIKFYQAKLGMAANMVMIASSILTKSFNQVYELYCDVHGLDLAVRAGYDGCAGMNFWNRMSLVEESPNLAGQLVRSHPYSLERVRCTHQHIKRNYHAICP